MSSSYLTSADVITMSKVDLDVVVRDIFNATPMLQICPARTCMSNVFYYTRATSPPTAGFRAVNEGLENSKTTRERVTITLGLVDGSFSVDQGAALADERGWEHVMAEEAMEHLKAAMFAVEKAAIYGDDDGFTGFADSTSLDATADEMVISAGGTVDGAVSSAFIVCTGPTDVEILWGQQGVLQVGDLQTIEKAGATTGFYPAFYHPITGYAGVKIASTRSVARIANIGTAAGTTLDDDLISDALSLFPVGKNPSFIVMSRRSRKQLQQSRTATNATGQPAPVPTEAFGVPIIASDAVVNTESLVS